MILECHGFELASLGQPEIGIVFKTASIIESVFEAIIMIACGVAWASAGFPRLAEVATIGGLGLVCFGTYVGIIWNLKSE